jgi:hypothetical protein
VRQTTNDGAPIAWPGACAFLAVDTGGTKDLPIANVKASVTAAIANWQNATLAKGCSYLQIKQDPAAALEAHFDYKNVVKFRADSWCHPLEPGQKPADQTCFDRSATAITTIFWSTDPTATPGEGAILDADIELNDIDFLFVNEPSSAPGGTCKLADLENTLTHELGHFQGLDHTCWDHAKPHDVTAPFDNNGKPVPDCSSLNTLPIAERLRITEATMYNFADVGETSKQMPKADDIAGICAIYPVAKDPRTCARVSAGGCSLGGRAPAGGGVLAGLAGLWAVVVGRRRRRG